MTETLALHSHILVPFKKKNLILIRCPLIISSFRLKLRKKRSTFFTLLKAYFFFYIKRILFKYDENEKQKPNFSVILYRYHSEKVYLHQL